MKSTEEKSILEKAGETIKHTVHASVDTLKSAANTVGEKLGIKSHEDQQGGSNQSYGKSDNQSSTWKDTLNSGIDTLKNAANTAAEKIGLKEHENKPLDKDQEKDKNKDFNKDNSSWKNDSDRQNKL